MELPDREKISSYAVESPACDRPIRLVVPHPECEERKHI